MTRFTSALILSATLGLHFSNAQAADASLTWSGGKFKDGDWSAASNWQGGDPNNGKYNATINRTGFRGVNLDKSFKNQIQTFNFNGGTLNTNSNTLTVNKSFNWKAGTLAGTGVISAVGGSELGGGGTMAFKDSAMVINKANQITNWNSSNFRMSFTGNSGFVNESDALFVAKANNASMGSISGLGKFDNHGSFVAGLGSPAQRVTINAKMNNHGFLGSQIGDLRLNGGGTSTGSFVAGEQGKITFARGVHNLQAGSSVTGTNIEFTGSLGTTNINGTYNVGNTMITKAARANFNTPLAQTETLTIDGALATMRGTGTVVATGKTTFRRGFLQGPAPGTATPTALLANGGLDIEDLGVKVLRGEVLLVSQGTGENGAIWKKGSIILQDAPVEGSAESRGSVLFNSGAFAAKAVGGLIAGQGEVRNRGLFEVDLPEIYGEQVEGEPRKKIVIKSNFVNEGVLSLQGDNLRIGKEFTGEINAITNTSANLFNGNFEQGATGITLFEIAGNERIEIDTLNVFKIAILSGGIFIKLVDDILSPDASAEAFKPEYGDTFTLIEAGEIILSGPLTLGGPDGDKFILETLELPDNRWILQATYIVPIPASIWLFMSALFGIWRIRVRQSR